MAKQIVNVGTAANSGGGDPLRTAFTKINENFTELYGKVVILEGGGVAIQRDAQGSIFGDDSTLLVDGVNSTIPASVLEGTATINVTGNATGAHAGTLDGDLTGSVFGDDSTVLVDGNNNKIVGAVDTTSLRTSEFKITLGRSAGETNQGNLTVAVGYEAGQENQGVSAVAVGSNAGESNQGQEAVAIGEEAGNTTQGTHAIAVGYYAGRTTQGVESVAIGKLAGETNQGANAIAIGEKAGYANQAANSIVINATGTEVYNFGASSLVITPIRSAAMTTILGYDAGTGEVTHNAAIPGYISLADLKTEVAASADFAAFKVRIAAL